MRKFAGYVVFAAVLALLHLHFQQRGDRETERAGREAKARHAAKAEDLQPEREDPQNLRWDGKTGDRESALSCDGRRRCSQMTSCEEATWFIRHCAGMEMDGDGDGVPCETQWCGSR